MSNSRKQQKKCSIDLTTSELAKNFLSFCSLQNQQFLISDHHRVIAGALMDLYEDKFDRLIINMPPRHGKSFLCSQYFPAWYLGMKPSNFVISASYGQDLANDFGRQVRNIMLSDNYKLMFDVGVSLDSKSQKRFNTDRNGSYFAVGRGSSIVGRGGHLIIIDDLVKNQAEARSELIRSNMKQWYQNTLYTRLMPGGKIIIINTRWHVDDLSGWLLSESREDWKVLSLPAIDNDKALWPGFYNIETLKNIRQEIGVQAFEAQYQQSPIIDSGNIIKREWIGNNEPWPKLDECIQSWDLSFKGNAKSDYVVGQIWGRFGADFYLIDQVRGQWDFTETITQIKRLTGRYPRALLKIIEDKANGPAVISHLKKEVPGLKPWIPKSDKVSRLHAVSPLFEAGNVHVNPNMADSKTFIDELIAFPNSKNDDQVDACTQALAHLAKARNQDFSFAGGSVLNKVDKQPSIFNI